MFHALGGSRTFGPRFQSLGMKNFNPDANHGLAMALGTAPMSMLDLAQGYIHLSDHDEAGKVHGISSILDQHGFSIYEQQQEHQERKIPLGVARLITYILQTPHFAPKYFRDTVYTPQCPACASKTGTTNMKINGKNAPRDGWLVTYNPDLLVIAWAGNTDASPLHPKAYGFNLNTALRNDVFAYLIEQGLTSPSKDRNYPNNQTTRRASHGEGYSYPSSTHLPTHVRNKL